MYGPMSLEHGTGLRLGIIWAVSLIFIYSLAQRMASTHCSTAVTAYPGINIYVCTFSSYVDGLYAPIHVRAKFLRASAYCLCSFRSGAQGRMLGVGGFSCHMA
ncbi:hypothetical protein BJ912DRAFT_1008407 [Pholiota molesta]|nr:hypothetical protein BJ912DRAFT_1008407 [Pholiota molesta]